MQLRNLVWATSKHDVYLMSNFAVIHWSSLTRKISEVLNVSGHVAPCEVDISYNLTDYFFSFFELSLIFIIYNFEFNCFFYGNKHLFFL